MEKKIKIIHVDVPIELHEYLKKLKGDRNWIQWFKEIQQDFSRLAEENKLLREKIELLKELQEAQRAKPSPVRVVLFPYSGEWTNVL